MNVSAWDGESLTSWSPEAGPFTGRFLAALQHAKRMDDDAVHRLLHESIEILGCCIDPNGRTDQTCGVVIGQVQSGKTMSFTTVAALAHDNGFKIVIVLAGTKNNLREQSARRLHDDLVLGGARSFDWHLADRPTDDELTGLARVIADRSDDPDIERRSVLINVLKHSAQIDKLAAMLAELHLVDTPVLVIDDEADQASLNTNAYANLQNGRALDDETSATFESIRGLRSALPWHTFLQYTATPYALMLLDRSDSLSADWARYVTPGGAYTGGDAFFLERPQDVLRPLDDDEIIDPKVLPATLPDGLRRALEIYLLSCAQTYLDRVPETRSMLVHPHGSVDPHEHFATLIRDYCRGLLVAGPAALGNQFAAAYDDLGSTVPGLAPLDHLLRRIPRILEQELDVRVVNSRVKEKVDFAGGKRFWILIGGFMLDRGFTVEGLTVTYMPRAIRTTSADVLLQRARFFGYRRSFFDHVRVFMPRKLIVALTDQVRVDEALRYNLMDLSDRPLQDWLRELEVPRNVVRLSRKAVESLPVADALSSGGWSWPRHLEKVQSSTGSAIEQFHERLLARGPVRPFTELPGVVDERESRPDHQWFPQVPVGLVDHFLDGVEVAPDDASWFAGLRHRVNRSKEPIEVVALDALTTDRATGRELQALRENPFSGGSKAADSRAYDGERSMHGGVDRLTLQLRRVLLDDGSDVLWMALHAPNLTGAKIVEI